MLIELLGGPRDGDLVPLDDTPRAPALPTLRFPELCEPRPRAARGQARPDPAPRRQAWAIYAVIGDGTRYVFKGWG